MKRGDRVRAVIDGRFTRTTFGDVGTVVTQQVEGEPGHYVYWDRLDAVLPAEEKHLVPLLAKDDPASGKKVCSPHGCAYEYFCSWCHPQFTAPVGWKAGKAVIAKKGAYEGEELILLKPDYDGMWRVADDTGICHWAFLEELRGY